MASKVWFITGCSSGFGAALTQEILSRGDEVIATARNASRISDLQNVGAKIMELDVTADATTLKSKAEEAYNIFGRIDFLINNAGFSLQGTVEELTAEEIQTQFDTNVFGMLNVTRAFLPYLRKQRSGVIGNISSIGAWRGVAGLGVYCSSKSMFGFDDSFSLVRHGPGREGGGLFPPGC